MRRTFRVIFNMTHNADIVEIFSSLQGEGLHAGTPMTFVRFGRCSMRCRYCDTPQGLCDQESCRVEAPPRSGTFREIPNPVSAAVLCDALGAFDDAMLSVTGGEPLEQAAFLSEWLPTQSHMRRILLETNGIHHEGLAAVASHVHVVSMDFKLPSSTGLRPMWAEHEAFLKMAVALGREVCVKIVITSETTDRDLQEAIGIVTRANKYVPIILQPASATLSFNHPVSTERLSSVERLCHAYLPDVRTVPQMHKEWNVL